MTHFWELLFLHLQDGMPRVALVIQIAIAGFNLQKAAREKQHKILLAPGK